MYTQQCPQTSQHHVAWQTHHSEPEEEEKYTCGLVTPQTKINSGHTLQKQSKHEERARESDDAAAVHQCVVAAMLSAEQLGSLPVVGKRIKEGASRVPKVLPDEEFIGRAPELQ